MTRDAVVPGRRSEQGMVAMLHAHAAALRGGGTGGGGGAGSYDDTKGKVGSGLPGAFLAGGLLNRAVAVTAAHALTADESVLLAHAVIALPFTAHGGSELNANSGTRHFAADGGFGECAKKKAANATNRTAREILMTDAFR